MSRGSCSRTRVSGALADLGLSLDPLSQNRYSLAGGNPISFVEVDGHYASTGTERSRHISIQGGGSYDREKGEFTSGSRDGSGPGSSYYRAPRNRERRASYNRLRTVAREAAQAGAAAHCGQGGVVCDTHELWNENFQRLYNAVLAGKDLAEVVDPRRRGYKARKRPFDS